MKTDANDILRKHGPEALREAFDTAPDPFVDGPVNRWAGNGCNPPPRANGGAGRGECGDTPEPDNTPIVPIDLWAKLSAPPLPLGILPEVIERFAVEQGEMMGADPVGLAIGALCVCAAAIPDSVKLQVKQHDHYWKESARLWVALNGDVSAKKTPIISEVARPIVRMDGALARAYASKKREYDKLDSDERKRTEEPKKKRLRIEDITIEGAQEILKDSHQGVLSLQDELSGWFGSMDKYSGGRGAQKDRGFWLQAYNGVEYISDRVGRGMCHIPNLSISLLGGIQHEPLRKVVDDSVDDGLIQRLLIVTLRPAVVGKDEERSGAVKEYEELVERLAGKQSLGGIHEHMEMPILFSEQAQAVRRRLEQRHVELQACSAVNRKLGAHLGKYDGVFARLCLIWHCIEARWTDPVSEDVALRVEKFLHGFLLPHAVAFYSAVAQGGEEHERLADVAGHILAHKLDVITNRDLARSSRSTKGLSKAEVAGVFESLDALGWVSQVPGPRVSSPPHWKVNPECHRLFAKRAAAEQERRHNVREIIQGLCAGERNN